MATQLWSLESSLFCKQCGEVRGHRSRAHIVGLEPDHPNTPNADAKKTGGQIMMSIAPVWMAIGFAIYVIIWLAPTKGWTLGLAGLLAAILSIWLAWAYANLPSAIIMPRLLGGGLEIFLFPPLLAYVATATILKLLSYVIGSERYRLPIAVALACGFVITPLLIYRVLVARLVGPH